MNTAITTQKAQLFSLAPVQRKQPASGETTARNELLTQVARLREDILRVSTFERERLGRELHDDFVQNLAGIACLSKQLQGRLQVRAPDLAKLAEEITFELGEALERVRTVAHELIPAHLQDSDLTSQLQKLVRDTCARTGIDCQGDLDLSIKIADVNARLHLYRISQEAIRNALHHGKATKITLELKRGSARQSRLTIEDNGLGFHRDIPAANGLGIRLMQYRAAQVGGRLALSNAENGGAVVECRFPQMSR